jgi:hypothetical protein
VERVIDVIEELGGAKPRVRVAARAAVVAASDPRPKRPSPVHAAASRPYVALTLYEAVAAHLATVEEPQTSRQIADALVAGGYPTRSSYFCGVMGTMLRRKESTRQYRISVTADGRRWFIRPRRVDQEVFDPSEQP